MSLPT